MATMNLARYKKALHNHLCKYDAADWLMCAGGHGTSCILCDDDNKLLPVREPGVCFHSALLAAQKKISGLEATVAELTKKFETQRSARRKYKKQLNRLSGKVVKKARGGA